MSIRLLLDEDVPILLAVALRERGFDVLHVTEAGLSGATDPVVFEWAVQERRSVVTHNARHFLPLVEHAAGLGQDHFGLLPVAQLPLGELLRRALRTLRGRRAEDLTNTVVWLV